MSLPDHNIIYIYMSYAWLYVDVHICTLSYV